MQLKFDREKCIGCFACHIACIDAHYPCDDTEAESFRTTETIRNKEEGFQTKICPGCIHCGACMRACPHGAIYRDEETGLILADRKKCTGCRTCEQVCPMHVIRFDRDGKMVKCDGCIDEIRNGRKPACVRTCFAGAICLEQDNEGANE